MKYLLMAGALAVVTACGKPADVKPEASAKAEEAVPACADGGAPLAGTGLCQSQAAELLVRDPNVRTPELEGCTWAVNEAIMPDGALLYYAATCGEKSAALGFAGGAERAEFAYTQSAFLTDEAVDQPVFWLYGTDPDPQGALNAAIAELPADEQAKCEIREDSTENGPAGILRITLKDSARAGTPANGIFTACGPFGVSDQSNKYWQVRQGYAWFFDLPNAEHDIDFGNMAIVEKGADGNWVVKP
jgi:hypothetical protein